jgi:hypothetical protein
MKQILLLIFFLPGVLYSQLVNDLKVNLDTSLSVPKYNAKVSSNESGNTVVVWEETGNSKANVLAQIFDNSFTRVGGNFVINNIPNLSVESRVAVRKDGSFGVIWVDGSVTNPYRARIFFKIYNKNGIEISPSIIVNDSLKNFNPRLAIQCDYLNRFIVAFDNATPSGASPDIYFQIVDSSGSKVGNNVKVNQVHSLGNPSIGVQRSGCFLIAWEGYITAVPRFDLFCQMFSSDGTPIGSNLQLNDVESDTLDNQSKPDIAVDSVGNFVVSFSETPYSTGVERIKYQRLDKNGVKIGSNKLLNGIYYSSFVDSDKQGNLVFQLNFDGSSGYIHNLRVDKNNIYIGNYFLVTNQFPNILKAGTDICLINNKIINVWLDTRLGIQPQIYMNVRSFLNPDSVVSVHSISTEIPDEYELGQNYPNPFNPATKINFALPKQGLVTLKIYDITSREVQTLVNEVKRAGFYSVDFNGSTLASGVYFYRIQSGNFNDTKRFVLIK